MLLRARHYRTAEYIDVVVANGVIVALGSAGAAPADHTAQWIAPALFDLQINGCDRISFNSPQLTVEQIRHVVATCRSHGMSGLCPTLVTNAHAALAHGFATLARACDQDATLARALPCFHLEGPYISPLDGPRGAHPLQHVRPPDWDEFCRLQEAAGGRIRLVTLAPEHNGALGFIEKLRAHGVVVAIGHTAASGPQLDDAVRAGAQLSTHLGNGCHATLPRHDNYIWQQLADDRLWASIICDGHHLPPSVIKTIVRVKSPSRTILTCDASSLAGVAPGHYEEWGQAFDVLPEGRIVVPGTPFLAGSWAFADRCIGEAVLHAGVSVADALDMAGARPRELLGLPARQLRVGEAADLLLFDWTAGQLVVRQVV